jgi:hypothetical protein
VRKWAGADGPSTVNEEQAIKRLQLKVFLEGPFNGTDMNTDLNNMSLLPLEQPYDQEPWYYEGDESLTDAPDPNMVDWVLVELRDATDAASATEATQIAQQAALLLNDGNIVGLNGVDPMFFNVSITEQLFVVIRHRNHLGVLSASALTPDEDGVWIYDFTTAAEQAHENGQVLLPNDFYGMIGGDANADGFINETDKSDSWNMQAGLSGYLDGDTDLDGQVDNPDKNQWWLKNLELFSKVSE